MKKALILLLATALIAALIWYARQEPAQLVAAAPVRNAPLEETLGVEGKTRLQARYRITAPVAGTLRRITLQAGDSVQSGQTLAEIEPAQAALLDTRSREQAQAGIAEAEAALSAAGERRSAAASAAELAGKERKRLQPLVKNGAASREQLDHAEAQEQNSQAGLRAAQAEEQAAAARLEAARAQLAASTGAPPPTLAIRAPVSGKIIRRELQSAQPVAAGQLLMEIGNPQQLEIEADVLSADAVRLAPNMPARVLRWGGDPLHAHITRIEPGGFTKTSALGVEEQRTRVILAIDSPQEHWQNLGDAYRVDLDIITRHTENALQIPPGALFRHGENWAVYRINAENRAERTDIQTGLKSDNAVQITHGLAEGDSVILQPDSHITNGSKVKAKE